MNLDITRKELIQEINFLWRNPKLNDQQKVAILEHLKQAKERLKESI
jgi:hypothetical protein